MYIYFSNDHILIYYFISDSNFTLVEDSYCSGNDIKHSKEYRSLQDAKAACRSNNDCTCITANKCDGFVWHMHEGGYSSSSKGSCSWMKGKFTVHPNSIFNILKSNENLQSKSYFASTLVLFCSHCHLSPDVSDGPCKARGVYCYNQAGTHPCRPTSGSYTYGRCVGENKGNV